ncbi:MAG: YjbQ family protein [Proteobacteria bacterium]|nr:YjbQ family protein [Pseudomonadota bacterium]
MNTTSGIDVLSVIHETNRAIREANAQDGLVTIIVPEPGAALAILEPLSEILEQFRSSLAIFPGEGVEAKNRRREAVPVSPRVVSAVLGRSVSIPLAAGKLVLGLREEPMLVDMDPRGRRREFFVQVMSEAAQAAAAGGAQRPRR